MSAGGIEFFFQRGEEGSYSSVFFFPFPSFSQNSIHFPTLMLLVLSFQSKSVILSKESSFVFSKPRTVLLLSSPFLVTLRLPESVPVKVDLSARWAFASDGSQPSRFLSQSAFFREQGPSPFLNIVVQSLSPVAPSLPQILSGPRAAEAVVSLPSAYPRSDRRHDLLDVLLWLLSPR